MILRSNIVWESTSAEGKPTYAQGARDGHFLKELDTGLQWVRRYGEWESMDVGLSFIAATKSGRITTEEDGTYHVDFVTPFVDDLYSVALSCVENPVSPFVITGFGSNLVNGVYHWDGVSIENDKRRYMNDNDPTVLLLYNRSVWELLQRIQGEAHPPHLPPPPIQASYYINTSDDPEDETWTTSDNGIEPIGTVVASQTEFMIPLAFKFNLTASGFDIQTRSNSGMPMGGITVSWLATRHYNP